MSDIQKEVLQSASKAMKRAYCPYSHFAVGAALATPAGHIRGAFRAQKESPEHVVLIDDVVTTGATAGEAAMVLIEAGAKKVDLVTLAVGA